MILEGDEQSDNIEVSETLQQITVPLAWGGNRRVQIVHLQASGALWDFLPVG